MQGSDIGFAPIKIDSGDDIYVISGVSGQLLKVDKNLKPLADICTPFPALITSSTILGNIWIGVWIERDLRQARMAALDLTDDWSNGPTKSDLRDYQSGFSLHPSSNVWSQILDSEPTALSQVDSSICFSTINRGIYKIDGESNEIWRAEIPKWSEIEKINTFDEIVAFLSYEEKLVLMSKAGGFAIIDENGNLVQKGVLKLPEVITGFQYEKELGWFIKLNGKYFATLSSLTDSPKIYKILGEPWHQYLYNKDTKDLSGEDIYFCKCANDAGIDVYVDATLSQEIAHYGTKSFRLKDIQ